MTPKKGHWICYAFFVACFSIVCVLFSGRAMAQSKACNNFSWAKWSFADAQHSTGIVNTPDGPVSMALSTNYSVFLSEHIYNLPWFSDYTPILPPDEDSPAMTWCDPNYAGTTRMTFSKKVTDPVLMIASLGGNGTTTIDFSIPFVVLYQTGNISFNSDKSITATEGYAIVMFPGEIDNITVNCNSYEFYSNMTWGVKIPAFPVQINQTLDECGSVTLNATGGVSYQWNGGDSPNSATNTFHQSGTYTVTVTNADGCTVSATKQIVVKPVPVASISNTGSSCNSVILTAAGGVSYHWDGGDTPNQASNTFHTSGTYTVTVTNTEGCTATAQSTVTIAPPPVAAITGDATGCSTVTLTATGGVSYSWNGGETPNSATNTFKTSGTYTVTVTDDKGCTATTSANVVVNTPPTASISGTTTNCDAVTLTASGGTIYHWDGGDTPNSATNTFHTSGTYTVTVTNTAGCTATASSTIVVNPLPVATISGNTTDCGQVTLTAAGGASYQWSGGQNPTSATNVFTTSGTYTVTVTSAAGCTAQTTINVVVNTPAVASISGTTTSCNVVILTATGGVTYHWDGGDTPNQASNTFHSSGTYKVTVTNAAGCTATAQSTIVVNPLPVATISGNATNCEQVTLTASGGVSYQWSGGQNPASATNIFTTSGTYTVTVTSATGCTAQAVANVVVNKVSPEPSVTVTSLPGGRICAGTPVTFTAAVTNAGQNPIYEWFKNNKKVANGKTFMTADLSDNDIVSCQVVSSATCSVPVPVSSNKVTVNFTQHPKLAFEKRVMEIQGDKPVQLTPVVEGNIKHYIWKPSIGLSDPYAKNPVANPQYTTDYELTVITDEGCDAVATVKVTVPVNKFIIPNTFTPNADGVNDNWEIAGLTDYTSPTVDIFDRYGMQVFHSKGYSHAWDGNYNGKPLPVATYYYIINFNDNRTEKRAGYVAIIR